MVYTPAARLTEVHSAVQKPADNSVFGPQQARQRMRVFERGYAAWMSGEDDEVDEDDCVLNRLLREQHAESRREGEAMDQRMQQVRAPPLLFRLYWLKCWHC